MDKYKTYELWYAKKMNNIVKYLKKWCLFDHESRVIQNNSNLDDNYIMNYIAEINSPP